MTRITRLSLSISAIFLATIFITAPTFAAQNDVVVEIEVPVPTQPPFDACPNIEGIQPSIPTGMELDENGDCHTPTPPPPPPVDLCANIEGLQSAIPSGYYRTTAGNCYIQSAPPVDICTNISGVQTSLPTGYQIDPATNDCVPIPEEPVDVCTNIRGVQTTTPQGMLNDNGRCYTPTPPPIPPTPEPAAPAPLKNVPNFLQPLATFFANVLPTSVKEFFRNLPEGTQNQLPSYVFVLVLILILIPIFQAIREYLYKRRLIAFYKRERSIAEQKDNFITLASHYLRTPITIMKDSIPLLVGAGDITGDHARILNATVSTLGTEVTASLDAAASHPALEDLTSISAEKPKPFYRSGFFWVPIIISAILTIITNFLIGAIGDKEIGAGNLFFQFFIIAIFIILLYLIVRNYLIQKKLREEESALIAHEQTIDATRNTFLGEQTTNITNALNTLFFTSSFSPPSQPYTLYIDGLSRLSNIQSKFLLLSQVKTGIDRDATTFDLRSIIDQTIDSKHTDISAKQLLVENQATEAQITQNQPLFSFVISSVLDNAIKFSHQGGQINISSMPNSKQLHIQITDNGQGIPAEKLDQLFQPFSRAESAVDFSYEGLGLSLFLDRLILTYTGGSITANSDPATGTVVTITTPTDITAQSLPLPSPSPAPITTTAPTPSPTTLATTAPEFI